MSINTSMKLYTYIQIYLLHGVTWEYPRCDFASSSPSAAGPLLAALEP